MRESFGSIEIRLDAIRNVSSEFEFHLPVRSFIFIYVFSQLLRLLLRNMKVKDIVTHMHVVSGTERLCEKYLLIITSILRV